VSSIHDVGAESATGAGLAWRSDPAPLIVTCALTGDHPPGAHPALPVTVEDQAAAASAAVATGAAIVHVHGRDPADPARPASEPGHYATIAEAMRERVPDVIVDFTQSANPVAETADLFRYTTLAIDARPDIMSLNPGPMTFRGSTGRPSSAVIATFDDTARIASMLRERWIKPQVFLYHPGHLDLLDHLIRLDVLDPPYWLQLVFGQQSGMPATPAAMLFMIQHLPPGALFQACAVGPASIEVGVLSLLLGGHLRTGLEDSLDYLPGEPAADNAQLVARVVRIAADLGRTVATPAAARAILGVPARKT
jgi:3-keto-5-aminohexanoate cleavage enzyme